MSSRKHTPGPWISDGERVLTTTGRDRKVADVGAPGTEYRDNGGDHTDAIDHYFEVVHANAALIAAAPDLLEDATNSRGQLAVMADRLDYALGHLRRESHDNWCAIHNDESAACNCWVQEATDGLRAARAHLADDAAIKKARTP